MVKKLNFENIKTQLNAIEVISLLEDYRQNIFKKNKKPVDLSKFGIKLSEETSMDTLSSYISLLKSAPIINVVSAVPLEINFLDVLYNYFCSLGIKDFLISTSVDSSICGGLLIEYKGLYHDLSLKKQVNTYVQQRK